MNTNNKKPDQQPSRTVNVFALDTALTTTGFSVYKVSTGNFSFSLSAFGIITTNPSDDLDTRVRCILQHSIDIISKHRVHIILPEEPSMTVYNQHCPKNVLIGRATSIYKLMASVYGIVGWAHAKQMYCRTVNPNTWQSSILGKVPKGKSKTESIKYANKVLKFLRQKRLLKTKTEENIADAINIGIYGIKCWANGTWKLPTDSYIDTIWS